MHLQKQMQRIVGGALTTALILSMTAGTGWAETGQGSAAGSTTAPAQPVPVRPPAAPAEPAITKEEAIAKVRQHFWLPEETATVRLDVYLTPPRPQRIWDISVMVHDGNFGRGFGIAAVDAVTGTIQRYTNDQSLFPVIPTGPQPPLRPEAEAQEVAWELVKQLYPGDLSALTLMDQAAADGILGYAPYPPSEDREAYRFSWVLHKDGIPFPNHRVDVALDAVTLEATRYMLVEMDDVTLPQGPAKLSPDEALSLWQAEARPQLGYVRVAPTFPFSSSRQRAEFRLAYQFAQAFWPIDALTGRFAVPDQLGEQAPAPEPVPVGDAEPVVPAQLPLSDEAVLDLARALLQPGEGRSVELDQGVRDYDGDGAYVRLTGDGPSATVMVDWRRGLIRNAWRDAPVPTVPQEQDPITPEREAQARNVAIELVQRYFSPLREELRMLPGHMTYPGESGNMRRYSFMRHVNGIPVGGESLMVAVDLSTLQWVNLGLSWTHEALLPSPEGVLTPEQAGQIFWKDRQPVLIYRPVDVIHQPGIPWEQQPRPTEAQLVYRLPEVPGSAMVDALTGERINRDGRPGDARGQALERISGHWAQGELRFFLNRQVILPHELDPAAPLTRTQAVNLLLTSGRYIRPVEPGRTKPPYSDVAETDPAYQIIATAYQEGWLAPDSAAEFGPSGSLTRAEFVVWAARVLELGELARSGLQTEGGFADLEGLTPEQRNAANFLRALGLLSPVETFRGSDPMTQAEGAALAARVFQYRNR